MIDERKGTAHDRGNAAEEDFARTFGDTHIEWASNIEDMTEHWDLKVHGIKYDVKKLRAVDEFGKSTHHWAELYNVNGQVGSLYGKSDAIAFEDRDDWIIVPTDRLRDHVKKHMIPEYSTEKKPYYMYKREGRRDKLVMVPTPALYLLASEIRSKCTCDPQDLMPFGECMCKNKKTTD